MLCDYSIPMHHFGSDHMIMYYNGHQTVAKQPQMHCGLVLVACNKMSGTHKVINNNITDGNR
jgi:hypothetical protein